MNKLKALIPVLVLLLLILAAVPACAGEAEDLTEGCTLKVVDKPGKIKNITDGKYTSYWESSKRNEPWVVISSDKPIYGLYLCFQKMPDTYVIQKQSGEDWVTVAEGGSPRFHHAFFELDGLTKIRILSTESKKNVMGFNEIFAFGEGEIPDWVQRWEEPSGETDILFLATHPDDDVLFLGSAITWYAAEQKRDILVAYLTISNTTRRSEALNGLWRMGVRVYPEFGAFSDKYSKPAKIEQAYKDMGGQEKVLGWVTELYRRHKPAVVVTQDIKGEYGHPQHEMLVDAVIKCWDKAADENAFPESAAEYGTWEVQKLYIHLYGDEAESTAFNWEVPMASMNGQTANEVAEDAFKLHVTQEGKGNKFNGKRVPFSVAEYGVKRYPNNRFGLYASRVGQDERHDDFLENIDGLAEPAAAESQETAESAEEEESGTDEDPEDAGETPGEDKTGTEEEYNEEETEEETEEEPAEETGEAETEAEKESGTKTQGITAEGTEAPEWADVALNARGYLDEGEYVLEDAENGHWMYVNQTLRIQIVRSWETPEKQTKKEAKQEFFCYTAEIWCDTANGELPFTTWSEPDKPREKMKPKIMKTIAAEQPMVFGTSTDYYTYRLGRSKSGVFEGVVIRDGEILYDVPAPIKKRYNFPTYETLALYTDGHVESWHSKEKSAEEYIRDGAWEVYTFGPCIVRDGACTEFITEIANRVLNPRHAFGMVEPGHYIDMICEGRLKSTNGSTGVTMGDLAQIMIDRGCSIAVNLDGGQTAVMVFMGQQLNMVQKSDPNGRATKEVLCFGKRDR